MNRLKERMNLSYANVVATAALVIAVAGIPTAVAVTANKVGKNAVTSRSIKNGSVTGRDLAGVRVETFSTSQPNPSLSCRPGEQLLSGGGGGAELDATGPTIDGNGWSVAPGGGVVVLCLKATPGK